MILFELLYTMERVFLLNRKKLKINSEYYLIEDIPYYTLKKEVDEIIYNDDAIEIILK